MTTLSYETAQTLKAAGWPQSKDTTRTGTITISVGSDGKQTFVDTTPPHDPPLEELLEACAKHFPGDFMLSNEGAGPWEAHAKNKIGGVWLGEGEAEYIGRGSNPKEALANFWLALPEELRVK